MHSGHWGECAVKLVGALHDKESTFRRAHGLEMAQRMR